MYNSRRRMFPAKSGEASRHRAENVPTETGSVFSKVVNIPTQGKNRGKRWDFQGTKRGKISR